MTIDRRTAGIVQSWLQDGVTALPDRVLDEVLDAIPGTPQRRAVHWPLRRFPDLNTTAKLSLAAAAVVAVALLGIGYFAGSNTGGLGPVGPPASGSAPPSPTATPVPLIPISRDLEAGTYRANASIPVEVLVTVPDGWSGGGDWLLLGPRGIEPPDGMNIRFGSVSTMYVDPLDASKGSLDPPVGPTVDDLVDAISRHPDWPTSAPADVIVDGYAGKVIRLTLPTDIELPDQGFLFWNDEGAGGRWAFEPGQIIDFYIIDVDGERLVLELFSYPDTPAADLDDRQRVIDTLELSPRP